MLASTERLPLTVDEFLRRDNDNFQFVNTLLRRTGFHHAMEFPSGRAGLYYALRDAGISGTDEVLVPAYTDSAVDQIVNLVATSVNVDISPVTFNLDFDHATQLVTDRTAAIIPTHMYGRPMDMGGIGAFADEHDLITIEDAAHALGAAHHSDAIGKHSDYAMFSFRFSKDATVFTGGLLLSREPLASVPSRSPDRLSLLKLAGVSASVSLLDRLPGRLYCPLRWYVLDPYFTWSAGKIGELRPRRFSARERALLGHQYRELPERIAARRRNAARYDRELPDLLLRPERTDDHVYWRYPLLVPPAYRDDFCRTLQRRGIGCSTTYAYTVSAPGRCPQADRVADSVLNLPVHSGLSDAQVNAVIDAVYQAWSAVPEPARSEQHISA